MCSERQVSPHQRAGGSQVLIIIIMQVQYLQTMKLFILLAVLFLHEEATSQDILGMGFYIPEKTLLGQELLQGRLTFKNPDQCKESSPTPIIDTTSAFYRNTANFYSDIATKTSISAELESDFTMGVY